ncbi:MAG: acyl-CoA dehydratase activase [Clostridia bacterium]|nr:acyl-CoA dehydratase activase [Clostridia bacterium]
MKVLGIDLGSREVKIVVMDAQNIIYRNKISTMMFYRDFCTYRGKLEVDMNKLDVRGIEAAVSTGYGRNNTDIGMFKAINEIKAHVYGALFQTGLKDFILLDIGGQDVKVVKVEKGIITDLELNEKCAASCGRYLENMAAVLEISLDEMSGHYQNPVELNSTCSVFSESELIGRIAEGYKTEQLCAGVNYSLYKRLRPLLKKFSGKSLVMSGGVARNNALAEYLKNDYDEIVILYDPQFNGAIGCCNYMERKKQ